MIDSFADQETEKIWHQKVSRVLPFDIQRTALRKLQMIDAAASKRDLAVPPGNHLEKLVGNRNGQLSVKINDKWRVCFRFRSGHATDVEICDYH
jgi:proteic killer suppression protein